MLDDYKYCLNLMQMHRGYAMNGRTFFGPGLVREILYRVLCGTPALAFYSPAMYRGTFSQVACVLEIMQSNYAGKLDVEPWADKARMSASAFHRALKESTSDSSISVYS